jgi:hypothetical protein
MAGAMLGLAKTPTYLHTKTETNMTLETTTEKQPGQWGAESHETGPGFVGMLDAVEEGTKEGLHHPTNAVTRGVDATGRATQTVARRTADALTWALDIPGHFARHPWILVGAVVLVGLLIVRRRSRD